MAKSGKSIGYRYARLLGSAGIIGTLAIAESPASAAAQPPPAESPASAAAQPPPTHVVAAADHTTTSSQDSTSQTIVVTGTRRDTLLRQTPLAITALSGAELQQRRIQNASDLFAVMPNVHFSTTGPVGIPSIRGLSTAETSPGIDRAVAVFVDDVYFSNGVSYLNDLYDVDQLLVLRGPQGTTFGRNTTGGTFVVTSRPPVFREDAGMTVTARTNPGVEAAGFYNGVLIPDTLAGRVTFSYRNAAGTIDNVSTSRASPSELGGVDTAMGRAQLLWRPDPNTTVSTIVSLLRDTSPPIPLQYFTIGSPPTLVTPQPTNPNQVSAATAGRQSSTNFYAVLRVEHDFEWATLSSATAYRNAQTSYFQSGAPEYGTRTPLVNTIDLRDKQFSEEILLTSHSRSRGLEWLAGIYYLHLHNDFVASNIFDPAPGTVIAGAQAPGQAFQGQTLTNDSIAGFAEGVYHFTPRIALRVGGRYTSEHKYGSTDHYGVLGVVVNPPFHIDYARTFDAFTPRAILEFRPTDHIFLFAGVSRGFKGGGWSVATVKPNLAILPLNPERVTSFEGGVRSSWFNNALTVNVIAFSARTTDLQVRTYDPAIAQFNITNAGIARTQGVEAEVVIHPTRDLTLQASYGFLDAKFLSFTHCTPVIDCSGLTPPYAPRNSLTIGGRYDHQLENGASVFASLSSRFASRIFVSNTNTDFPAALLDQTEVRGIFDASLGWRSADRRWGLTLWGKNITNQRPIGASSDINVFALSAAQMAAGSRIYKVVYD